MKKNMLHVTYHIAVVVASAAIAFSLPDVMRTVSLQVLLFWSYIGNQELFVVATEIAAAVTLIIGINLIIRVWGARKRSRMTEAAGLDFVAPPTTFLAKRKLNRLKREQGAGRNVMIVNATGSRSLADPEGDLHQVLRNCREAKIMLLDPLKDGVVRRAKSLADPDITPEILRDQIIRSIDFLKGLRAQQKKIRLKLYPDVPLLKMAILGDYLSLQHYPSGLNVRNMPEYVFKHARKGNLFNLFYQYFVTRWLDPAIPEYDLDTDDVVYRDKAGNEQRREQFNEVVMES
ncbi:MAG TPA: hypothetical protein VK654_04520 [Nitrospirota bacterium]|nr:hypothetical protein [Nitrospirota bacterium]